MSGFRVDTDGLRDASKETRVAAAIDAEAAGQLDGAVGEPADFGPSGEAQGLAAKWNRAVQSRRKEVVELADRTEEHAQRLDRTADTYEQADDKGSEQFKDLDPAPGGGGGHN
ncbi:MAG: hypothetical protein GEV03_26615 [Streptosporangiales bacterium]|nr:hypothetical protein [Streptosporangiales bacterium]